MKVVDLNLSKNRAGSWILTGNDISIETFLFLEFCQLKCSGKTDLKQKYIDEVYSVVICCYKIIFS